MTKTKQSIHMTNDLKLMSILHCTRTAYTALLCFCLDAMSFDWTNFCLDEMATKL